MSSWENIKMKLDKYKTWVVEKYIHQDWILHSWLFIAYVLAKSIYKSFFLRESAIESEEDFSPLHWRQCTWRTVYVYIYYIYTDQICCMHGYVSTVHSHAYIDYVHTITHLFTGSNVTDGFCQKSSLLELKWKRIGLSSLSPLSSICRS